MPKTLADLKQIYNNSGKSDQWKKLHYNVGDFVRTLGMLAYYSGLQSSNDFYNKLSDAHGCFLNLYQEFDSAESEKKLEKGLKQLPDAVKFLKDPNNREELTKLMRRAASDIGEEPDEFIKSFDETLDGFVKFYEPDLSVKAPEAKAPDAGDKKPVKAPEVKNIAAKVEKKAEPGKKDPDYKKNDKEYTRDEQSDMYLMLRRAVETVEPEEFTTDQDRLRHAKCICGLYPLSNMKTKGEIGVKFEYKDLSGKKHDINVQGIEQAREAFHPELIQLLDAKVGGSTVYEKLIATGKTQEDKEKIRETIDFAVSESIKYNEEKKKQAEKAEKERKAANKKAYGNIIKNNTGRVTIATADQNLAEALEAYNMYQKKISYNKNKFEKGVNGLLKQDAYKAFVKNADFRNHFLRAGQEKLGVAAAALGAFQIKYPKDERGTLDYNWENYIWKHTGPNAHYSDYKGDLAKVICANRMMKEGKPFNLDAVHKAAKELQKTASFKVMSRSHAAKALFETDIETAEKLLEFHKKDIRKQNAEIAKTGPARGDSKSFGGYIFKHSAEVPENKGVEYLAKCVAAHSLMEKDVTFNLKQLRTEAERLMRDPDFIKEAGSNAQAREQIVKDGGASFAKKLDQKQLEQQPEVVNGPQVGI